MMIVGGVGGDDVTIVCQWRHCCTFSCFWWAFVFTFISALSQIYFSFSQFFPRKGKAFWKWCHNMRKWLQIDFLHRSDFSLVKLCDFGSVRPAGDIVIKKVFHCFPPHSWIVSSRSINAIQSLQKNLSIFEFILEWAASVLSRRTRGPPCKWILPGMILYHDYYEFWSSWLLWSFGLFWVYLHVKLSCARWDYLWWLFILISIIIMIITIMLMKLRWIECKMSSSLELLSSIVFR